MAAIKNALGPGQGDVTLFALTFQPNIELASTVRRFVSELYERIFDDPDATARVALATQELIENSVKYAETNESSVSISFDRATGALTVTTANVASPANSAVLAQRILDMAAASDAEAYYQALVVATATQTDGSGLGLGRVSAEAEMRLGVEVEGNKVRVRATTTILGGNRHASA